MICVFDIETIPDFHLLRRTFGYEGSPLEIAQIAFRAQYEKNGSEFLPLCFHRVISISSVICDEFGRFVKVGHFGTSFLDELTLRVQDTQAQREKYTESAQFTQDNAPKNEDIDFLEEAFLDTLEKTLLSEFWQYINKHNPKLVSFNGRNFDIPTLLLRAMRYDISALAYYEQDNPAHNKSKWENYRQRYSEQFHTDLFESLGHFGALRSLKLDYLCQMLDLVGKYDMSGEQVFEIYFKGDEVLKDKRDEQNNMDSNAKSESMSKTHKNADFQADIESQQNLKSKRAVFQLAALMRINHYCHSDVLNTYWLYLKYELLKGNIAEADYYEALAIFCEKIPQDKPYSAIFIATLQRHITAYTKKQNPTYTQD
ncbi:3'-5' exonuclease [Helicobacter sp.]|uniref:3'-5' exonuclease n=1 Tax=Helicobacter sp. TaxID=218 RepID=UPI0025C1F4CF|nr:3'-5' exonuclease [Helicobacter sp.]